MADDEERLVVLLEARIRDLEKNMAKASGITGKTYREMSLGSKAATAQMERDMLRSTTRINQALSTVGSRVGDFGKAFAAGLVTTAGLKAAQQLIDTATRIDNALKVAGLSGKELTEVYDSLYASAQRNAAPIESLATLYSRLALTQKELGVSQAELLNFTDKISLALRVGGTSATEASGSLLQLSQALGGGIVRAEEFNSVLEGTPTIAQAVAAGLKEAGGSVSRLRTLVVDGKVSSEAFFRAFEAGAVTLEDKVAGAETTVSQQFVRLQNVLIDTAGKIDDATDASGKMGNALEDLAGLVRGFGVVVSEIADSDLGKFVGWISSGIDKVNEFKRVMGGIPGVLSAFSKINSDIINGRPIGTGMKEEQIQGRIDQAFDDIGAAPKTGRLPAKTPVKPVSLDDFEIPATGKNGRKASSSRSVDDLQREISAIKERTASLQAETAVQAGINPLIDDFGFAIEKARAKQDLLTAAQKAGKEITPELAESIDSLAQSYADASAASEQLADKQDKIREAADEWASTSKEVTKGFISDLNSGVDAADALVNALGRIADKLLNDVLDSIFKVNDASAGGGGGGFLDGILGLFKGGGSSGWSGGMTQFDIASGGGVGLYAAGGISKEPAIFGEAGPEAAVPLPDGRRIPVDLGNSSGGNQDVKVTADVRVSVDQDGNLKAFVENVSTRVVGKKTPELIAQNERNRQNYYRNGGSDQ